MGPVTLHEDRNKSLAFLEATSYGLLFLVMCFQMVHALLYVKAFLFFVVLAASAFAYAAGHTRLDLRLATWTIGLAIVGFLFVLEGFFSGAPGAHKAALLYVVWPVVYVFWISALARRRTLYGIHRTAVVATLFIALYASLFLLTQVNVIPETRFVNWLSLGWEAESFGAHEGYTGMQFPGLNSLPFLLPYLLAYVSLRSGGRRPGLWEIFSWAACILGFIVTVVADRRALTLVTCLGLPLTFVFMRFQREPERRLCERPFLLRSAILASSVVVIFFVLNSIYQFDLTAMWNHIVAGFTISPRSADEDAVARQEQLVALLRGWLEHPFVGAGHGASVYGSIRSETMPWSYELCYVALLYQTGVIGVGAYAAGAGWIFLRGVRTIRAGGEVGRMTIAVLVGLCGALMAHATNPYLDRFDGMWMFFLPLAVINYGLTATKQGMAEKVWVPHGTPGAE